MPEALKICGENSDNIIILYNDNDYSSTVNHSHILLSSLNLLFSLDVSSSNPPTQIMN